MRVKPLKPLNHRLFKLILLLAIWAGLELGMTLHGHSQTIDCNHDNDSIEYYDNMRTLPGAVSDLKGTEVTLRAADKHTVVVRTFHLTDKTKFFTERAMIATPVDRTYFESHLQGCWVVRYCAHCRVAYKLIRMET
jgi:hypothetical protein